MQVTALLTTINNTLAAWPHGPLAPDLDQPASCRPFGKSVGNTNSGSDEQSQVERNIGGKGLQRALAGNRGRTFNVNGEGGGMMRRQGRRSLSRHVDHADRCVGGGQLAPGQGIAWVGGRKTADEAASATPVLGIGLSLEQRYLSV